MDIDASLEAPCDPAVLFSWVDDLARYVEWTDVVHSATADGDVSTWRVELRARVGPFARSKQLRMVRTLHDSVQRVVEFERRELDGKKHAPWVLRAEVDESGEASTLRMHLHYGGALWTGGVLERALAEQITSGRERLAALVSR